jgi:hypothetical protein
VYVDGDGVYRFVNRHHYLGSVTDSDKIISDETVLMDATLTEGEANIRNSLRLRIFPRSPVLKRTLWNLGSELIIPAASSVSMVIEFSGVLTALDTTPSSTHVAARSRFRAALATAEGTGEEASAGGAESYISFTILPIGRIAYLTITNSHSAAVALNDGAGDPYFYLYGSMIQDTLEDDQDRTWITVEDIASIYKYGRRGTEIEFKFIATPAQAEAVSSILLHRHQKGIIQLENVKIPGDARLEIADEVALSFERWSIDENYIIESIRDYLGSDSGHTQTLNLMQAETLTAGTWFRLDESELDTNNALAI